jgi:dTDP-4-dehydrorhamnose reductase
MVLGSGGMLGSAVSRFLAQSGFVTVPVRRREFDITCDSPDALRLNRVDYVINAAGVINRRLQNERAQLDAALVNSVFPHRLADACELHDVRLIHVSTDCVFDGSPGKKSENHLPRPKDFYALSKYLGEPPNCMVIRSSFIGPEVSNHYCLLCWFLSQRAHCHGFVNHRWNGVTTWQMARCLATIIHEDLFSHGIQHIFGEDTTKFELLDIIRRVFNLPIAVEPFAAEHASDMRLMTRTPAVLAACAPKSLQDQIEELRQLCDDEGRWLRELVTTAWETSTP